MADDAAAAVCQLRALHDTGALAAKDFHFVKETKELTDLVFGLDATVMLVGGNESGDGAQTVMEAEAEANLAVEHPMKPLPRQRELFSLVQRLIH